MEEGRFGRGTEDARLSGKGGPTARTERRHSSHCSVGSHMSRSGLGASAMDRKTGSPGLDQ